MGINEDLILRWLTRSYLRDGWVKTSHGRDAITPIHARDTYLMHISSNNLSSRHFCATIIDCIKVNVKFGKYKCRIWDNDLEEKTVDEAYLNGLRIIKHLVRMLVTSFIPNDLIGQIKPTDMWLRSSSPYGVQVGFPNKCFFIMPLGMNYRKNIAPFISWLRTM